MKAIKIIDLLNKIANGEEVPKKIKWRDKIWTYNNKDQDYEINDTDLLGYSFCNHRTLDFINDEVVIVEDAPKKIPKKIDIRTDDTGMEYIKGKSYGRNYASSMIELAHAINEAIDYLKSKGE